MTGEMFGQYRLDELIGRGGMGEVYRAFDTVRDRAVAIKRLPARLAADAEFEARFRAEAALVARLREPHIIPIHDYGEIDGRLYIDMRLVEGSDLAVVLAEQGPLAAHRAVTILTQVAAALDVAHAENLVHRDIKPGNVLITPGGGAGDGDFAYVADFGIARAVSGGSTSLTATGATVGSLDYMAPERFGDGHGDHRVDVYSLGCLLYEMLTGRKPFPVEGLPAMINAHLNTPPPRPSTHVPDLPVELDAVVARAMAKDPDDRYPSAGAVAVAARAAVGGVAAEGAGLGGAGLIGAGRNGGGGAPTGDTTVRIGGSDGAMTMVPFPPARAAAGGVPRPRGARRGVALLAAIAAMLAVVGGGALTFGFGGQAAGSEVRADGVRDPGDNPFMPPVGEDRVGVTPPPRSGGGFSGGTFGLYGGSLNEAVCKPDAMVAFLQANPDKAAAWAGVQGIAVSDIPRYVAGLTPVILRSDVVVTNHGFANGRATVVPAVLQAGIAVLVDAFGVPRARCSCGNPLTPATPISAPRYVGTTWAGFSPAAVTTVQPAATPIAEFTLVDPITEEVFLRPAGTRGEADRPAGPTPTTPDPTTPFTPDPTMPFSPDPPPPYVPDPTTPYVQDPTIPYGPPDDTPKPPAPPTGLTATPVGPNAVELRWTDNSGGNASYEASNGASGRSVPSSRTTYTWTGLDTGSTTCFRVTAFSYTGASAPSNEACATTEAVPTASAPVIVGTSSYQEGVLLYIVVRFTDQDGDAAGFGFNWIVGDRRLGDDSYPFTSPSYGRVSPGRVDYPFNHDCGGPNEYESSVEAWIYDSGGRVSQRVAIPLRCG